MPRSAQAANGEAGGDVKKLVQSLDEIGLRLPVDRPRAPLELLARKSKRDDFLALMEQVLETLAG